MSRTRQPPSLTGLSAVAPDTSARQLARTRTSAPCAPSRVTPSQFACRQRAEAILVTTTCSSTAGFLLSILPVSLPSSSGDGERRVRPMRGGASIVPRRVESERFVASSTRQRFVEPPERLVTQRFVEAFERLVTPPRDTFRSAIAAIVLPAAMVVTSSSKRFRCDLRVELCIFELCIFELSDLHIFGAFATASPSSGVSAAGFSGCAPASVNILILLARASAVTSAAAALSIR